MNTIQGIETTTTRYMKQIIVIAVAIMLSFGSSVSAQNITISFDTVKATKSDSVVVPVYVSGFTNVGAITMFIPFDTASLSWGRALSWHTGLNGNIPLLHHQHGTIGISWIDVQGVTIPDGPLFELKFVHRQGHTPIDLGVLSEFANPNGVVIPHSSSAGLIWEALSLNPDTTHYTICVGGSQVLDPKPLGSLGSLTYSWSSSDPGFSSTQPTVTVSPQVTTNYTVTVSDGVDAISVQFTVDQHPNIPPAGPTNQMPSDSATGVHAPYMFSWTPSAYATHYDLYLWKATEPMPAEPTVADLTQINYTYTENLLPGTWYKWKVVTKNACFSTQGVVLNFETRALPNLNVTDVTTSQPLSGQPLTVSWTVTNNGLGPTVISPPHNNWIDYIYIVPYFGIRLLDQDYHLLGQFPNISALAPGASYVNTQTVQVPQNLYGPYFLFVFTDMYGAWPIHLPSGVSTPPLPYTPPPFFTASSYRGTRVEETVNNDNFFYTHIDFPTPPLADFITTQLVTPANAFSGQSISVSYTVKNIGTNITPANANWFDRVWLSPDSILDLATAVSLKSKSHNTPLHPDSSYSKTVSVTLPNQIYGTYYLIVQNDATNQVFEGIGEDNNIRISDPLNLILTPPADLMVAFIQAPDSASIREQKEITWAVANQGGTATPPSGFWDEVYISHTDTFNLSQSIRLARVKRNGSLSMGGNYTVTHMVTIPEHFSGSGYIYVVTDADDQVFEHTNTDNNIRRSDFPMQVLRPDFIPSGVVIPTVDSTSGPLPVEFTLNNAGPGNHLPGKSIRYRLYISPSSTWDPNLMTEIKAGFAQGPIPAGGAIVVTDSVTIPDGEPGPFYVYVVVNKTNPIPEVSTQNNTARSPHAITIERPDLMISHLNVPSAMVSGEGASLSWTVKNDGAGRVNSTTWTDSIVMSKHPVYHPDSLIGVGSHKHHNQTLLPGETITTTETLHIPHGHIGTFYFYVITDVYDAVYEKGATQNNTSAPSTPVAMTLGPWADLTVSTISVQDTAVQGDVVPLVFSVVNAGTKAASATHGWKDKVYISSSHQWNTSTMQLMNTHTYSATLLPDSSYQINTGINIPLSLPEGFYYFYVYTDAENSVYEYTDEGNNIMRSDPIYIKAYPPIDLATTSATAPASANSGTQITVGWSVHNYGLGTTLAAHWYDGIFLSPDPVFSAQTAIYLGEKRRNGPMAPGHSYSTTHTVTIPNGLSGTWYLIVVADRMDIHHDVNRVNNASPPQTIAITLTPSPDLVVTDFTVPISAVAGQPVKIGWEVSNLGIGPTLSGGWIDRLYLSSNYTIEPEDPVLGSKAFSGSLAMGQSYQDSATFFVPAVPTGNYVVIIKTDNNNVEYEHNAAHNNTTSAMMFISSPPPADLHVTSIQFPDSALADDMVTIEWTVKNSGSNPATGFMKDNVYLSNDTTWDIHDLYLGYVEGNIDLQPLTELTRSLTVPMPGLTPGEYYIIVRTDANNNIPETDVENNTMVAETPISIDLPLLPIEVLLFDTLFNMQEKHYRVVVPDSLIGETMVTMLKGDSAHGVNELYMTHNRVSSRMVHDFAHTFPYQANQEVMVPYLDTGSYFLLAFGHNTAASYQEITLFADILEFDIRMIHDAKGGNSGITTVQLMGSKFDSAMTVYLDSAGVIIPMQQLYYGDITHALVSFDLDGAMLGRYDLVAVNSSGDTVRVEEGFHVIEGESPRLGVVILHAANTRPNRISAFTIEYANQGNTDLLSPTIRVVSLGGAPIAEDIADLTLNHTELVLPLSIPGEPPGLLRPGAKGSVVIYTRSITGLGIMVSRE